MSLKSLWHCSLPLQQAKPARKVRTWQRPLFYTSAKLLALLFVCSGLFFLWPRSVMAQANCQSVACVTTGPRLASVDAQQNVLLNGLLSSLSGANLNLSVADTNALAQAEVGENDLLNALQTKLGVATPGAVLTSTVTLAQVIQALAQVSNDSATVQALNVLSNTANLPTDPIQLGDLLKIDPASGALGNTELNVLALLTGSIELDNAQNVATTPTPVTISGSALGLGNLIHTVALRAQVVEPPVYVCGKAGAQFYSASMRLSLAVDLVDVNLASTGLKDALQTALGNLVTVDVAATLGQFNLYVDVARGAGVITQINAVNSAVTLQATPGVTNLYLGAFQDSVFFDRTHIISATTDLDFAQLGTLGITLTTGLVPVSTTVGIEAKSYANGAQPGPVTLNFAAPYPQTQTASTSATFTTDLLTDLVAHLQVRLTGSLGATLDPLLNSTILPNLNSIIGGAITNNTLPINSVLTSVADPLLADSGIGFGEMDVTVNGIAQVCDTDGDGIADAVDSDADGDGIANANEGNGTIDTDHDGTPDSLDQDSDNDHVLDAVEGNDADHNGQADRAPSGHDVDHDGIDDAFDPNQGGVQASLPDTDQDGKPDFQDVDDDGDGVNTVREDPNGNANPRDDDTDHDGRPDYLDPANTNPCLPDANALACATGDTDGDGTPNGSDPAPTDPCIPNPNALACATGDADGDGVPNGSDPAPTNPCVPNANATACLNDTDGDGTPNGNDPEPANPCVPNANAVACPTGDADGDGTPNGSDPAPLDPCIPNANAAACATGDTDHDGTSNGSDPAPTNPCVPNLNSVACSTGDTDGDGTPNGTDPAPTDPCIPNANAIACTTGDADGDGTPNGTDPGPMNPCIPNANATACANDTDGDGTTTANDPEPTNPCVPNVNAGACPTGDADGDGTPNGADPEVLNPCVPNINAMACSTGDPDNDGTPTGADSAPTDPCLPNPASAACIASSQTRKAIYLPMIFAQRTFLSGSGLNAPSQ